MADRRSLYSYRAQKGKRNRLFIILAVFIVLYIIYNCLTAFFFSVWVVDNNTMQPGISSGDRLIFTSFKPPWGNNINNAVSFKRGDIVLVDMRHERDQKWPLKVVDGIVRFFTAQRVSVFSGRGQHYIKRVIALPGDEISMVDYVFRVRAAGTMFSLTEYELSDKPYHPAIARASALWDGSLPFSGSMDTIILGPGEIFVVSDDRSNTNDSRTWGPVSPSQIAAKAVLRFWPLNKLELF
jgi:signal peptidase I